MRNTDHTRMESETLCLGGPLKLRDYIHIQSIGTEM